MDRDEMSNLYRGPATDASYQVSIHLAREFRRRFFLNPPIRNKSYLWRPCLLTDRDEMCNLSRRPSRDAAYQVSVHLSEWFYGRRLKCEKLTGAKWWQKLTLPLATWAKKNKLSNEVQVYLAICVIFQERCEYILIAKQTMVTFTKTLKYFSYIPTNFFLFFCWRQLHITSYLFQKSDTFFTIRDKLYIYIYIYI